MDLYRQVPNHAGPDNDDDDDSSVFDSLLSTSDRSYEDSLGSASDQSFDGSMESDSDASCNGSVECTSDPSYSSSIESASLSSLSASYKKGEGEPKVILDTIDLSPEPKHILHTIHLPTHNKMGSGRSRTPERKNMHRRRRTSSSDLTPRASNTSILTSADFASGLPKSPLVPSRSPPTKTTPLNNPARTPNYGIPPSSSSSKKRRTPHSSGGKLRRTPSSSVSSHKSRSSPKTMIENLSYILNEDSNQKQPIILSPEASMARWTPQDLSQPRHLFNYFHLERRGTKRILMILTIIFVGFSAWTSKMGGGAGGLWSGNDIDNEENYYYFPEEEVTTRAKDQCPLSNEQALLNLRDDAAVLGKKRGVVAADDETCSEMGVSMMRDKGGNAMDAAVTTALCLGVMNPGSSGIGGGAFILVHMNEVKKHRSDQRSHPRPSPRFDDARGNGKESNKQADFRGITELIDCREVAPSNATSDMYTNLSAEASVEGPLSIAIPGELRGLELAHYRHGKLSWSQVMEPVVQLAEFGVPVSKWLAKEIKDVRKTIESSTYQLVNRTNDPFLKMITKGRDKVTYLKEGNIMRRPEHAHTLRSIMEYGADYMYSGIIAEKIADDIQRAGGIITAEDMARYRPTIRDPVIANVNGFNIVSTPPPSSGGAVIIGVLRFLSGYSDPFASFKASLSQHRMVEAFKHGFAIRMSMSDPAFNTNVTQSAVTDLIKDSYMEDLRRKTSDMRVLPLSEYGGDKWAQINSADVKGKPKDRKEGDRRRTLRGFNYLEDHGTSHLSVVDKDRNAVAITTSINFHFGSKFVSSSTGILFNDVVSLLWTIFCPFPRFLTADFSIIQMDDFGTPGRPNAYGLHPSEANFVKGGKRPLSSMAPTMLFYSGSNDEGTTNLGRLFMVLGSSGGPKIITSIVQVIINHVVLGLPLYEAVTHPRLHNQLLYHMAAGTGFDRSKLELQPAEPIIEVRERTLAALRKRGQYMFPIDYLGTTQAVSVDLETDKLTAVSDVRKSGQSAGY